MKHSAVAGGHVEGRKEMFEKLCTPAPYITAIRCLLACYGTSARRVCL